MSTLRKLAFAASFAALAASATVASATSFFDGDHYYEFMREHDRDPMLRKGVGVGPVGMPNLACVHTMTSGKCRTGGGGGGFSGGGGGGTSTSSTSDSPEEQKEREGNGKDVVQKAKEKASETAQKSGIKKVVQFALKVIPKAFGGFFVDLLWPVQTASDDVTYPEQEPTKIFNDDGSQIGETNVPDHWQPDGLDRPEQPEEEPPEESDQDNSADKPEASQDDTNDPAGGDDGEPVPLTQG